MTPRQLSFWKDAPVGTYSHPPQSWFDGGRSLMEPAPGAEPAAEIQIMENAKDDSWGESERVPFDLSAPHWYRSFAMVELLP